MRTLAALSLVLALSGCDLLQKLQNRKVMGAVLLQSPAVAARPASPPLPALPDIPRTVTAQLFFGERTDDLSGGSGSEPRGLSGAVVKLSWLSDAAYEVTIPESTGSPGYYELTGGALAYAAGADYTFRVTYQGEVYSATVRAPAEPALVEFSAPHAVLQTASWATFTGQHLSRACPAGGCTDLAFYTVMPVNLQAASLGTPTCDNFPRDAKGLIDLVVDPTPWKVAGYDLQKGATPDCFPSSVSGQVAALTLVVAQKSATVSGNLFLGSTAVAGASGAGGIVFTP
jgi:hypothetical protein